MTAAIKRITIVLFCAFPFMVLLQTALHFVPDPTLLEKRVPAPLPSFSMAQLVSDKFFVELDRYANDNFGFRKYLIRLNNLIDVKLFHTPSNTAIILGKEDFLFSKADWNSYVYRHSKLNDATITRTASQIRGFQDRLEARGTPFILVLAPNKGTIYPEYLGRPRYLLNDVSDRVRWVAALEKAGVRLLDPTSFLLEAKKRRLLFYKGDHHWNRFAGLMVTQLLVDVVAPMLGVETPRIVITSAREDRHEITGGGSLDELLGVKAIRANEEPVFSAPSSALPPALVVGDSFIRWLYIDAVSKSVTNVEKSPARWSDFKKAFQATPGIKFVVVHYSENNLESLALSDVWSEGF